MYHCPVGVWVIEQHAIILSATVRSPTAGKATGTVRVQTDIRTRGRWKSKWTTGGYSDLRTERKGDSISLFEISPGIGWRADYMQPLLQSS